MLHNFLSVLKNETSFHCPQILVDIIYVDKPQINDKL